MPPPHHPPTHTHTHALTTPITTSRTPPSPCLPSLQGRHALFYIASSVGLDPLEIQAWARWYATADMNGYMKNDEAFLARLSRQMSYQPDAPRGSPKLVRAWKKKGDVSRCIPPFSEHLPRLFRFAEHVVKLATGEVFPTEGLAQIAFIAAHLPVLSRDAAREPVAEDALSAEDRDVAGVPAAVPVAELIAVDFEEAPVAAAAPVAVAAAAAAAPAPAPIAAAAAVTAEAASGINAGLATQVALLTAQVAILVALLTAVAMSCATAGATFVRTWAGLGERVGCLPQSVVDINAGVRTSRDRCVRKPAAAVDVAPAVEETGGGMEAADAQIEADTRPALPRGLSPEDAYYLVGVMQWREWWCAASMVGFVFACAVRGHSAAARQAALLPPS